MTTKDNLTANIHTLHEWLYTNKQKRYRVKKVCYHCGDKHIMTRSFKYLYSLKPDSVFIIHPYLVRMMVGPYMYEVINKTGKFPE
jgi:hypothetical protein